jgi:8-oxo-dGTP pyrophosphatase MutT (NUDIX family)
MPELRVLTAERVPVDVRARRLRRQLRHIRDARAVSALPRAVCLDAVSCVWPHVVASSVVPVSHPVSVKGVLLVDGRLVLVENSRDEWELPGGRVEPGEDHARALMREFLEELSVEICVADRIDSYLFEVVTGQHVQIVTYGCTLDGAFSPLLSDEHVQHCLWPVDRLSEIKLPEGYRRSAEHWSRAQYGGRSRSPSTHWGGKLHG